MISWKDRNVLVTGAAGLVGSWLVAELLERGANVVAFILSADPQSELYRSASVERCKVVQGDLREPGHVSRAINENDCDTVFHLGAQTLVGPANRAPLETWESNVRGTYLLMEACRELSSLVDCIVIASSDKAYGSADVLPYKEDTPLRGLHPYDCSKSCTDLICATYANTYNLPVVTARCGNIYGGGDLNWSRIVPGTIRWLLNQEQPVLRSDGSFLRDYVFVKDACDAYITMAENVDRSEVAGNAFNFGPGEPLSVLRIVQEITEILDCGHIAPDIRNGAKGEIKDQYLDSTAAIEVLGWCPKYTLREGLIQTIHWYSEYLGIPVPSGAKV